MATVFRIGLLLELLLCVDEFGAESQSLIPHYKYNVSPSSTTAWGFFTSFCPQDHRALCNHNFPRASSAGKTFLEKIEDENLSIRSAVVGDRGDPVPEEVVKGVLSSDSGLRGQQ